MCESGVSARGYEQFDVMRNRKLCFVHLCHLAIQGVPTPNQLPKNMLPPEYAPREVEIREDRKIARDDAKNYRGYY